MHAVIICNAYMGEYNVIQQFNERALSRTYFYSHFFIAFRQISQQLLSWLETFIQFNYCVYRVHSQKICSFFWMLLRVVRR